MYRLLERCTALRRRLSSTRYTVKQQTLESRSHIHHTGHRSGGLGGSPPRPTWKARSTVADNQGHRYYTFQMPRSGLLDGFIPSRYHVVTRCPSVLFEPFVSGAGGISGVWEWFEGTKDDWEDLLHLARLVVQVGGSPLDRLRWFGEHEVGSRPEPRRHHAPPLPPGAWP